MLAQQSILLAPLSLLLSDCAQRRSTLKAFAVPV